MTNTSEFSVKEIKAYIEELNHEEGKAFAEVLQNDSRKSIQKLGEKLVRDYEKYLKEIARLDKMLHYERELREHGIEVILGGAQLPEEAAETAIQEDVDFIGFRNMAGDPVYLIETLLQKLREKGADIPVIVGGIIRPREVTKLKEMGIVEVFGPGTSIDSIASLMEGYHRK